MALNVVMALGALVLGLLVISCVCGANSDVPDKEMLRRGLIDTACSLRENSTAEQEFFKTVRAKHGVLRGEDYVERYSLPLFRLPSFVECFSPCPNVTEEDITWCVNIFSDDSEIELCLNSTTLINATYLAEAAGITDHFSMPQSCVGPDFGKDYYVGCLYISNTQYYLNNAYLTCTSQSSTCYRRTFVHMEVGVNGYDSEPPTLAKPLPEVETLILGETSVLECSYIVRGLYPYTTWRRNGTTFRPISIDFSCNPAQQDCTNFTHEHPEFPMLLEQRVHMFQSTVTVDECPTLEAKISNYLVINNVSETDAGTYLCEAYILTLVPFQQWVSVINELQTVTVPPVRIPKVENFPNVSQYVMSPGQNASWTCITTAGSYDNVSWVLDNRPIQVVDLPPECTHPQVSVVETVEYLMNYTSRYHLVLHICNATDVVHDGIYSCMVEGGGSYSLGSMQVSIQGTQDEKDHTSSPTEIIVPVIVCSLLILMLGAVLLAVIWGISRRRKARIDFPSDIFTPEEPDTLSSYEKKVGCLPTDPMEFPRKKLYIYQDKVLGEGTFGKVLQARAEGIVEGAPQRNIVAIKTTKENATSSEINDLWEELLLMKRMEPHENILNLLGHCSTQGGPLCLIVEYATYGSLKDFLRECEEVVFSLNHVPYIARSTSKCRNNSCSSSSSSYPLLVDKTPLTAQSSVLSDNTPNGPLTFTFPPSNRNTKNGGFGENPQCTAHAPGVATPFANSITPITHDYINSKGIVYMEDVQNFALQIACGLQHLEGMQVVHCDLAARNILIAEGFVLKIADFGMAREVGEKAYYRKNPRGRVPVKWTAPEALEQHLFTHKSDIWSYGVVLWELFTYAHSPYPETSIRLSWEPFIAYLKDGNRLPKPVGCPHFFYDLMLQCWDLSPDHRPSSTDLVNALTPEIEDLISSECGSTCPDNIESLRAEVPQPSALTECMKETTG